MNAISECPVRPDPARAKLSKQGVRELLAWIREKAGNRPYGCIIQRNGFIGAEFYGGGFTADSLFEIGSIRKSFNGALIGNGIKDGKVRLDVKASDVWPELVRISGQPKDARITLHDLVSGVSGWLTPDPPRHTFTYNNAGFTAAEKVVARLCGLADDEIAPEVERRFKGVLSAESWRIYHFSQTFDPSDIDNPGPKLAIDSNLRDLIKWGYLWLNQGVWNDQKLIPPDYVALATRQTNPAIPNAYYGYNWFVNTRKALWPSAPADAYGHVGFGTFKPSEEESRAYLWICPSLRIVAAVVSGVDVGIGNDFLEIPMALTADWVAGVVETARP
jgi:CubicO group peptidase (beta-lactamase class C family)